MSRGTRHAGRPVAVWVTVTAVAGGAVRLAAEPAASLVRPGAAGTFADLLVAVSALALVVAAVRLWVVTTVTVGQVLRGGVAPEQRGATRRLVLAACGAALVVGAGVPTASATEGDDALVGLSLPDRAVSSATSEPPAPPGPPGQLPGTRPAPSSPAPPAPGPQARPVHVVQPGESLWSIASATSPVDGDVDARWRAIWAANRDVVGQDPHLIHPGQRLRLPQDTTGARPDRSTDHSTDRSTDETTDETGDRP